MLDCLFEISVFGTYLDSVWMAGIMFVLVLGNLAVSYPVSNLSALMNQYMKIIQSGDVAQLKELKQFYEKTMLESIKPFMFYSWKMSYTGYLLLSCIACLGQILLNITLAYSIPDPRGIWNQNGGIRSVMAPQYIIVQQVFGLSTIATTFIFRHSRFIAASELRKATWQFYLFWFLYASLSVTNLVIISILWPFWFISLLSMAAVIIVSFGVCCCSICFACISSLLIGIVDFILLCCIRKEETRARATIIILFMFLGYVLIVASTMVTYALVGGPSTVVLTICILNNTFSHIAFIISTLSASIVGITMVIGFLKSICNQEDESERSDKPESDKAYNKL